MSHTALTKRECQRIRWYRKNSDLTMKQIGVKFGISAQTVAVVLAGKYKPVDKPD